MSRLIDAEAIADMLGEDVDMSDVRVLSVLDDASALVLSEAPALQAVEDDEVELRGNWTSTLQLPKTPVTGVSDVEVRAQGEEAFTTVASFTSDRMGRLIRLDGYWGGDGGIVRVTYSHGYETVPADAQAVCKSIARRLLVYADRYSDGQVQDPAAGVSVGLTELEARVLRRYGVRR